MKYFKNTELAKIYNVSEKSVRNWIQAAQEGKINLELYEKNGKYWVANTRENITLIQNNVEKGKKYKNRRALKMVEPTDNFYKSYTQTQILDIISNISKNREIPTQYSYVDGGAYYWDTYANRLNEEDSPNVLNRTIELLKTSGNSINAFTQSAAKINIIDLGPGNGLPVRPLIQQILDEGKLLRYIAIDSSQEMLSILEKNIEKWFGSQVKFEGHVIDFTCQRFDHVLEKDYSQNEEDIPTNIVCLLGGTLGNFKSPAQVLQSIHQSMGTKDILIYTAYLDTPHIRRYFDFSTKQHTQKVRTELILGKLNITDESYGLEVGFDEKQRARYSNFVPKVDICIQFKFSGGTRRVELAKNTRILLWRHWHRTSLEMINQFDAVGFDLLHAIKSSDQEYLLTISALKQPEN